MSRKQHARRGAPGDRDSDTAGRPMGDFWKDMYFVKKFGRVW